jgi:hypothetical protein
MLPCSEDYITLPYLHQELESEGFFALPLGKEAGYDLSFYLLYQLWHSKRTTGKVLF